MSRPAVAGLMVDVQRQLESLYALDDGPPVSDFLISEEEAERYPGAACRTLVSQEGECVALGVVIEGEVRDSLVRRDPRLRLGEENLGPFCALTEEVSHFLLLLFRARLERPVSELELELQGEIDKYLSALCLLSLQNEGAVSSRLRELLFRNYRLRDGISAERASRYHAANEMAWRYSGYLESRFLRDARLPELVQESRRFYRLGQREKLERISSLGSRCASPVS